MLPSDFPQELEILRIIHFHCKIFLDLSLHPGVIDSELWRHQRDAWYGKMWAPISAVFFKTELQGAQESAVQGGRLKGLGQVS